jgi:hypothetical protein
MIAELESIWKDALVASSRYYPGLFFEGLRKATKYLCQNIRCRGKASNPALPDTRICSV